MRGMSGVRGFQQDSCLIRKLFVLAQLYRRGIRVWGGAGCCLSLAAATSNPNELSAH
jgi:hypothetical protein